MKACFTILAIWLLATVAFADTLAVGTVVDFDRLTSTNPDLGAWDRGTIVGTTNIGGRLCYKIRNAAGTPYTIPADPRWIRSAGNGAAPDGTHVGAYGGNPNGGQTGGTAGGQTGGRNDGAAGTQGGARGGGSYPPGTRVAFDRVEAENPANGRWDEGVVVGRTMGGQIQIRGNNGLLYRVREDPRWIRPAGGALPGPRHDITESHNQSATQEGPAPRANGPGGPLQGEWVIVQQDGQRTGGYGMTINFVGSRYEFIFGGQAQSGTFTLSGSTIRMVGEDGVPFGTFRYSIAGNRLTLQGSGASFVCERAHR